MTGIEVAVAFMAVSAAATVASGIQANQAAKEQQKLHNQAAEQERIKGIETGNEVLRDLIARDAANNAGGAAGGLILSGSFDDIQDELFEDAERNLRIGRSNAAMAAHSQTIQGNVARQRGTASLIGSIGSAAGTLATASGNFGGSPSTGGITPGSTVRFGRTGYTSGLKDTRTGRMIGGV